MDFTTSSNEALPKNSAALILTQTQSSLCSYTGGKLTYSIKLSNTQDYPLSALTLYYLLNPNLYYVTDSLKINNIPRSGKLTHLELPPLGPGSPDSPTSHTVSFDVITTSIVTSKPERIINKAYATYTFPSPYWPNSYAIGRTILDNPTRLTCYPPTLKIITVPLILPEALPEFCTCLKLTPTLISCTPTNSYTVFNHEQIFLALTYQLELVYLDSLGQSNRYVLTNQLAVPVVCYNPTMEPQLSLFGSPVCFNPYYLEVDLEFSFLITQ